MALDGIGPKIAQRLHAELGISTAQDLIAAAERGKIRELYGFGARSEVKLARAARSATGGLPDVA
jgi:DNA polymerase (family X)